MEMRMPPRAIMPVPLPPPAFLWSVLGVFRPPAGAELVGAQKEGSELRLDYAKGEQRWRFVLEEGRLRRAEWHSTGSERQSVELKGDGGLGLPKEAVYRDWGAFRELNLKLSQANVSEPFPPETWTPGRP
jgi:hypothetical protein